MFTAFLKVLKQEKEWPYNSYCPKQPLENKPTNKPSSNFPNLATQQSHFVLIFLKGLIIHNSSFKQGLLEDNSG